MRAAPEDFRVDEVPAYLPTGAGPHLYVRIEKRGRTTRDVVRALAQRAARARARRRVRGDEGQGRGHDPVALLPGRGAIPTPPRSSRPACACSRSPATGTSSGPGTSARTSSRSRSAAATPEPGPGGRGGARRPRAPELLRAAAVRDRGAERRDRARAPRRGRDAGGPPRRARPLPAAALDLGLPGDAVQPLAGGADDGRALRGGAPRRRPEEARHGRAVHLRGAGGGRPPRGRVRGLPGRSHVRPQAPPRGARGARARGAHPVRRGDPDRGLRRAAAGRRRARAGRRASR